MSAIGIIPARLQSTRLPGKLLLNETGKPLIQYAWEAASKAQLLDEVIVATDSNEIAKTVSRFGGRVVMTGSHPSGTDRIAEVIWRLGADAEIIVNIQGDEPETDPADVDALVQLLKCRPDVEMATLATPITSREVLQSPSCVKVVCGEGGRAIYFSRSVVPHVRDVDVDELLESGESPWLLHLGMYAYRRAFLLNLTVRPPSELEQLEKLEQLRALDAGATIFVATVARQTVGIDTPADYARFVERQQKRAA